MSWKFNPFSGKLDYFESGSGIGLSDPGADRLVFWDESAPDALAWLATGDSISISGTTIDTIQDIRTSASPSFTGLTVSGGTAYFGADDTVAGILHLYGSTTKFGGKVYFYLNAASDTSIQFYKIDAYYDYLMIGPDTDSDALKLDANLDFWITAGSLITAANEYHNFGATQGITGYGLRDNSGAMEYKDSGGSWIALNSIGGGGGMTHQQILARVSLRA